MVRMVVTGKRSGRTRMARESIKIGVRVVTGRERRSAGKKARRRLEAKVDKRLYRWLGTRPVEAAMRSICPSDGSNPQLDDGVLLEEK
jgi:hypothetical protein